MTRVLMMLCVMLQARHSDLCCAMTRVLIMLCVMLQAQHNDLCSQVVEVLAMVDLEVTTHDKWSKMRDSLVRLMQVTWRVCWHYKVDRLNTI